MTFYFCPEDGCMYLMPAAGRYIKPLSEFVFENTHEKHVKEVIAVAVASCP